jgi:hypothetical protein
LHTIACSKFNFINENSTVKFYHLKGILRSFGMFCLEPPPPPTRGDETGGMSSDGEEDRGYK